MKPSRVVESLELCIAARRPVFLWGGPGSGKSDVVAQVATRLNRELIDVRALLLDPVDLKGIPHITEDGDTRFAPPNFLPKGKGKYILFLDELNAAPPLIQASCYQLVLDRKIGEYTLPDGVSIVAAGNRETDRAVTSRMPSPLANRFIHLDFDVDLDDWVKWASTHNVQPELIAFLRYRPNLLYHFDPKKNTEKAFPTPRSWEFTSQILSQVGKSLEYDLISGIVGQGAASELIGFLDICRKIPDPDEVLRYPKKVDVPDDPATLYAICGALAYRANESTFSNLVVYANRLPDEFSVLLIKDSLDRDENLTATRAFIEWSRDHADILI